MPHKIDQTKIADIDVSRKAVAAAGARLTQIETAATATNAQLLAAVKDMAKFMKHIIKVLT
jgi:hypothetical protein